MRLIDADALRTKMYHDAFGTDTKEQKSRILTGQGFATNADRR